MIKPEACGTDTLILSEDQRLAALDIQLGILNSIRNTELRSVTPAEIEDAWQGAVHEVTLPVDQRDLYNS